MLQAGAEQEWKLGQLNLETAGKGLFSVNNQVSVVSVKSKSALGMPLLLKSHCFVSLHHPLWDSVYISPFFYHCIIILQSFAS